MESKFEVLVQSVGLIDEDKCNEFNKGRIAMARQFFEAIDDMCEKEEDGLEVYENRHGEGKGDGIWVNAEDWIKISAILRPSLKNERG